MSNRLIGTFAAHLSSLLVDRSAGADVTATEATRAECAQGTQEQSASPAPPAAPAAEESLDLLGLVAPRMGRAAATLVPVLAALVLGLLIGRRRR